MGKRKAPLQIPSPPSNNNLSLIKALKPKVYIIDSLNFKNLVQELTGNGNGNGNGNGSPLSPPSSSPSSPPLPPPPPPHDSNVNVQKAAEDEIMLGGLDHYDMGNYSTTTSSSSSYDHVLYNNLNLQGSSSCMGGESSQVETTCTEESFPGTAALEDGFMESWLFQIHPFPIWSNTTGLCPELEEAACIYDYDLDGSSYESCLLLSPIN